MSSPPSSTTAFRDIIVTVEKNVGTIKLNRPARGNAITPSMGEELKTAILQLQGSPDVRVIILTGSGKFFCTGMDLGQQNQEELKTVLAREEKAGERGLLSGPIELFEVLRACPKPVIAKVNGPALGGGWGLVFVCDFRIVGQSVWFQLPEVKRGIVPALISAYIAPQVGTFHAKQLMLLGTRVSAQQALAAGFVSAVVDDSRLDQETAKWADELLTSAPGAMAAIKRTVTYVSEHPHPDNLAYVQRVFADTVHGKEARYGMACFAAKQQPDWSQLAKL